jgi:vacuolar iron transporter family protein
MRHTENHYTARIGWLRAAVLGANDGIVSTSSLLLGVAAANVGREELWIAGTAGLVAGALSMAAGEYVSVSSQADVEKAEIAREKRELLEAPELELLELTNIYERRGLSPELAAQVAQALSQKDPLLAHQRDELGLSAELAANPIQAALASAASFAVGSGWPLVLVLACNRASLFWILPLGSLAALAGLGALAALAGRAPLVRATLRVVVWGALAMAVTALVGRWFGTVA